MAEHPGDPRPRRRLFGRRREDAEAAIAPLSASNQETPDQQPDASGAPQVSEATPSPEEDTNPIEAEPVVSEPDPEPAPAATTGEEAAPEPEPAAKPEPEPADEPVTASNEVAGDRNREPEGRGREDDHRDRKSVV